MRWSAAGLAFFLALTACAGPPPAHRTTLSRAPGAGSAPRSVDAQEKVSRDDTSGARLRLESGEACPASDRRIVGVRNDGSDEVDGALAPNEDPTSGLVCVYAGMDGRASALLRQAVLPGAAAVRVARAARSVTLGQPGKSAWNCPAGHGSATAVVLSYSQRPAVDLWLLTDGCPFASNGQLVAFPSDSLVALIDLVNQVSG